MKSKCETAFSCTFYNYLETMMDSHYFLSLHVYCSTIAKINLCGGNYMPVLLEDMTIDNIPERLGGKFTPYNERFEFDRSVGGPLHCGSTGNTAGATGPAGKEAEAEGVRLGAFSNSGGDEGTTTTKGLTPERPRTPLVKAPSATMAVTKAAAAAAAATTTSSVATTTLHEAKHQQQQ